MYAITYLFSLQFSTMHILAFFGAMLAASVSTSIVLSSIATMSAVSRTNIYERILERTLSTQDDIKANDRRKAQQSLRLLSLLFVLHFYSPVPPLMRSSHVGGQLQAVALGATLSARFFFSFRFSSSHLPIVFNNELFKTIFQHCLRLRSVYAANR